MLEFMFPAFKDSKYIPTDSDKSPGLADGISYKELMEIAEFAKENDLIIVSDEIYEKLIYDNKKHVSIAVL